MELFHNIYWWKVQGFKNIKILKKTIKDVRNLFRLKEKGKIRNKWQLKVIRNLFRQKNKQNKAIKTIIRDIRNLFEHEKEDYYKPVRVGNFLANNYVEYDGNGNRKALSVKKYLHKIRPYLKNSLKF